MSEATYLGKRIQRFSSSPQFDGYSKVILTVSDDVEYTAGNDLGRALRLTCPWGTEQMAKDILRTIKSWQYQPYTADGAILDPAAELGDGVTVNNVYSGIYAQTIKFGPMLRAAVSAPEDEEINHEYPYKSKPNKAITRETRMLRASLAIEAGRITAEVAAREAGDKALTAQLDIQANMISAKVSKTGGDASTFGWELTDTSWVIKANNSEVLKATKSGLTVTGKIIAKSGEIGGLEIVSKSIRYNKHTWTGTNEKGIYIGTSGIRLGTKFKVDLKGNLEASSGRFTGTVWAGKIKYGDTEGYVSGSGIAAGSVAGSRLINGTVSTTYTSAGINASLAAADFAKGVFNEYQVAKSVSCSSIKMNGKYYGPMTIYYTNASGETSYVNLIGYR